MTEKVSEKLIQQYHTAASNGDIAAVKQCIAEGVDIDCVNKQRRSAILLAAMNKHYELVEYFISIKVDINQQDETCFNPFLYACLTDDLSLLKIMIKANANLEVLTRFGGVGITPAAEKGYVEIVETLLIQTEINANHTNFVGWTPLLEAIVLNDGGVRQQQIVKLLLDHGANPNMTDKYGKTPLYLAREKGYHEIEAILLASGAK